MRARFLQLLVFAAATHAFGAFPCCAETLGEVLAERGVPSVSASHPTPDRPITSYGILDTPAEFCIAFYWDHGDGRLDTELQILHLHRASGTVRTATLDEGGGSITRVRSSAGFLFFFAHRTPSAGSTLVVSKEDLSYRGSVSGWPLAVFQEGTLVFHRSQVHFAPVHMAHIALYDPGSGEEQDLWPRKPYKPALAGYVETLRRAFAKRPAEWFSRRNRPNDPEWFDSSLSGRVEISEEQRALAFGMVLDDGELYEDGVERAGVRLVYVFRGIGRASIEYVEILDEGDLQERYGAEDLAELLHPEVLERVFEK